jgi:exopolysaccharide biosynthesis polyprenyl glycosylphosphotransferase
MSMIVSRIQGWRLVDLMVSSVLSSLLFWVLYALQDTYRGKVPTTESYLFLWAAAIAGLLIHGASQSRNRRSALGLAMSENLSGVLSLVISVAFAEFATLALLKDMGASRVFLVSFLLLLPLILLAGRKLTLKWVAPWVFDRKHRCGVVLVGPPSESAHLVEWVRSKKIYGLRLLGYVADTSVDQDPSVPHLGRPADMDQILLETNPGVVVANGFDLNGPNLLKLKNICNHRGARVAFSLGATIDLTCALTCYQEDGVNLLALCNEPLEAPFNRIVKRSLDVLIALPVVVLVLPLLAIPVWLIHRAYSPGPLLFRQERSGLRGKLFVLLKFRTMNVDNPDEARQATAKDPRVFKGGGWMRRLSLDEFPQFINVLLGHMSVVGPRPHFVAHDDRFAEMADSYRLRSLIKPGITGLAQVKGFRGPTLTAEHVQSRTREDLYYLENWSLLMDVVIIVRTAFQFLRTSKNAL